MAIGVEVQTQFPSMWLKSKIFLLDVHTERLELLSKFITTNILWLLQFHYYCTILVTIFMQLYVTTLLCSFPHVPLLCILILNIMVFTKLLGPHVALFFSFYVFNVYGMWSTMYHNLGPISTSNDSNEDWRHYVWQGCQRPPRDKTRLGLWPSLWRWCWCTPKNRCPKLHMWKTHFPTLPCTPSISKIKLSSGINCVTK